MKATCPVHQEDQAKLYCHCGKIYYLLDSCIQTIAFYQTKLSMYYKAKITLICGRLHCQY